MMKNPTYPYLLLFFVLGMAACGKQEAPVSEGGEALVPERPVLKPGEMVMIAGGEFVFGDEDKASSAYPQQKVDLPAFWIDKYEVTNAEYLDFSIKAGYSSEGQNWRLHFTAQKAKYPVMNITWNDAAEYCKWAGKRLPTEAEWEKAARGTDGFRYPWGNTWESGRTNTFEAGLRDAAEIAEYDDTSPYGVKDMLGNVQEWTASWYKGYKGNPKADPNFGERYRVVRGLSHSIYGSKTPVWTRSAYLPKALYGFGCRCAKDATPEEAAKASKGD